MKRSTNLSDAIAGHYANREETPRSEADIELGAGLVSEDRMWAEAQQAGAPLDKREAYRAALYIANQANRTKETDQ